MSAVEPGDIVCVRVGGIAYPTVIDAEGVQRFVENPQHPLVLELPYVWDTYLQRQIRDMNTMYERYHNKAFSQRDYAELYMAIGYSLSGFEELSVFQDLPIENPLWATEPPTPPHIS